MPRFLREAFPTLGFNNVSIEEIVISVSDVEEHNLPRIPLKRTDTRLTWFRETFNIDYGVEIDALPPDILRQKIGDSILDHLDVDEINRKIEEDNQAKLDILGVLEDNS